MATSAVAIHVAPEATPECIALLMSELAKHADLRFRTVQDLRQYCEAVGIGDRTEIQHVATSLGLLERDSEGIGLSPVGRALDAVRRDARGDVLHGLIYSRWIQSDPLCFPASWAYRQVCDTYSSLSGVDLTDQYLDQVVEDVINLAETTFASSARLQRRVSFSRKSLLGVGNWLAALNPSVIDGRMFRRRSFCPPELLLLAVGYAVQGEDGTLETDILLSRERRDVICRVCLLEPDALDRALDWMLAIYPSIIEPGTSAGFYGRFVRLHQLPSIADVVR